MNKDIIDRIRQVRQKYAGPRGKAMFSNHLGISPSTYNYYEKDRVPPIEILWKICELTGCSLAWLVAGKEENDTRSHNRDGIEDPLVSKIAVLLEQDSGLAPALQAFLDLYEQKNLAEKEIIPKRSLTNDVAKRRWLPVLGRTAAGIIHCWPKGKVPDITELGSLIEQHGQNICDRRPPLQVSVDPGMSNIPEIAADTVSVIQLSEPTREGICEFVDCTLAIDHYPDAFVLHVDGDSMSPGINDSDLVILSQSVPARNAAAAVIQVKNQIGVTCKLYRRQDDEVHLIPTNENYDHQIIPCDQLEWALAVLWRIRL